MYVCMYIHTHTYREREWNVKRRIYNKMDGEGDECGWGDYLEEREAWLTDDGNNVTSHSLLFCSLFQIPSYLSVTIKKQPESNPKLFTNYTYNLIYMKWFSMLYPSHFCFLTPQVHRILNSISTCLCFHKPPSFSLVCSIPTLIYFLSPLLQRISSLKQKSQS